MAHGGYVWQGGLAGGSYSAPRLLEDSFVLGEAHSQLFLQFCLISALHQRTDGGGRGTEDPAPALPLLPHTPGLEGEMNESDYFTWRCFLPLD